MTKKTKETKEEFCGVCAAIPLAFAGGGGTAISKNKRNNNVYVKFLYAFSVLITILSMLYIIYYFCISDCKKCKL